MQAAEDEIEPKPNQRLLTPLHVLKAKASYEVVKNIELFQKALIQGYTAIFEVLKERNDAEYDALMTKLVESADSLLTFVDFESFKENQQSLQKKIKLPDEYLEKMFQTVVYLNEHQRFEEAVCANMVCISFDSMVHRFWRMYGIVLQNQNKHAEALYAFQVALMFDENDAYAYAYMARSYIALKFRDEAVEALNRALEICRSHDDLEELKIYSENLSNTMYQYL